MSPFVSNFEFLRGLDALLYQLALTAGHFLRRNENGRFGQRAKREIETEGYVCQFQ